MGNQSLPFQEKDVRRVLGSPEGQKLLKLLNRDGGQALRQAADALKTGSTEDAKRALEPLLATDEAAELLRRLSQG